VTGEDVTITITVTALIIIGAKRGADDIQKRVDDAVFIQRRDLLQLRCDARFEFARAGVVTITVTIAITAPA